MTYSRRSGRLQMTANEDSADSLREEILEQAREESGEIIKRASAEAEKILAAAAAEAQSARDKLLEKGRAEARRRRELIESTVPVETGRIRVARIESLLESIREEARKRLLSHEGFEYREVLIILASLAISGMDGASFTVKIAESDRALLDKGLPEEITRRVGGPGLTITLAFDPTMNSGGVSIEDRDASQIWDNGLAKRLDRMWPELRQQVALAASFVTATHSNEGSQ
jgi:vacuolar-type H+-ATPase subunit E/Vma4